MASIASYLGNNENQIVTVPAGTYQGADGVFNANPDTTGQYSGYLILVAAGANPASNLYPVTIDSRTTRMRFQTGSARIVFVGFRFTGLVDMAGASDVKFWYCDFAWDTDAAVRSNIQTWTNALYNAPRAMHAVGSTRTGIYGSNFHDSATAILASQKGAGSAALHLEGVYIHDAFPSRTDNKWHSDCIADDYGRTQITCTDFTFTPEFGAGTTGTGGGKTGGGVHQECHDGNSTNVWRRGWVAGSANQAFETFGAAAGSQGVGGHLDCTLDTIHHWGNNTSPDITDPTAVGNASVTQTNMTAAAPGSPNIGTNDPAYQWRTANPYSTYLTFFNFAQNPTSLGSRALALGVNGITHGGGWSGGTLTQAYGTDLPSFGQSIRIDIRMSQVYSGGWRPGSHTGWNNTWGVGDGYDQQIALAYNNGVTTIILCVNDIASVYAQGTAGYPSLAHTNEVVEYWTDLVTRYKPGGAGGIPATCTVWFEFMNEANQAFKNGAGQSDIAQYATWFDVFVSYTRAAYPQAKILLGSAAASPTNKLAADTWTSRFASSSDPDGGGGNGWDRVNNDGTGQRKYAALDWFYILFNNPANVLGSNALKVNGKFDGIAHHTYWGGESPFNTATARGATFPAFPTTYRLGYGFSHIRDIKDVYQMAVNAGNTPARCKIHATEVGGSAPTYWSSAVTYAAGAMVFQTVGSWNAGTRTWTRTTRYKALTSSTNSQPSTHLGSTWAVDTAGWGGRSGGDVEEGDEVGRYIDEILKCWFDPDGTNTDADGVSIGPFTGTFSYYNLLDNSTDGNVNVFGVGTDMFGIRTHDGTSVKGSSSTTSLLYRFQQQALLDDTRSGIVVHSNPTCAITAPTVNQIIVSGGPTLTVTWTYTQTDGDAEGSWRVRLLNKAETVTYYDSGWTNGTATSKAIDMVATFGSQFADTSNGAIHARVSVRSILGVNFQGDSAPVPFDIQWGLPQAFFSNPTAGKVIMTSGFTLAYSYTDTRGSAIATARYRVFDKNNVLVHDSGVVTPS